MDAPIVNSEVNSTVVSAMAMTAIMLRFLDDFRLRSDRRRMHLRLDTLSMSRTPLRVHDLPVLNADDAVRKLGDLLVVSDHDDGLAELFTRHF